MPFCTLAEVLRPIRLTPGGGQDGQSGDELLAHPRKDHHHIAGEAQGKGGDQHLGQHEDHQVHEARAGADELFGVDIAAAGGGQGRAQDGHGDQLSQGDDGRQQEGVGHSVAGEAHDHAGEHEHAGAHDLADTEAHAVGEVQFLTHLSCSSLLVGHTLFANLAIFSRPCSRVARGQPMFRRRKPSAFLP